jgi:nucleotide-binding universal stress UspA family protein
MGSDPDRAPVVVAVADADPTDDAVEWAAAEAAARDVPLVVVHVEPTPALWSPVGPVALPDEGRPTGRDVLAAALGRAVAVAAESSPSGRLVRGAPVPALVELSRGAGLLVLGGTGGERARRHSWSLTGRVAARACCPVAVVRSRPRVPAGRARPRVVVGVDVSRGAPATLELAFRSADRRGVPLVAVHAWGGDVPADLEGVCGSAAAGETAAREALDRALVPWRRRFGAVPVEARLRRAGPVTALLAESAGAALLVVGSRARVLGPPRSPVGRTLLQRADAPTVVVRAGRPGREGPGWSAPPGSEAARSAS